MWVIRDVISEALARANIVGRRQVQHAPGDKVMDALDILRDIAADFTSKNLLQWLQETVEIPTCLPEKLILNEGWTMDVNFWVVTDNNPPEIPSAGVWDTAFCWDKNSTVWDIYTEPGHAGEAVWRRTSYPNQQTAMAAMSVNGRRAVLEYEPAGMRNEIIIGELDETIQNDYVDVEAKNLDKITAIYYQLTNPTENGDYNYPLGFVSYEDFWNGGWGSGVYTWQPISDTKVKVYIKNLMANQLVNGSCGLKVVFCRAWHFDLDSEVRAPDVYRSLFLSALTYRLAVRWPRLDATHTQRLKEELDERIATVSSKTRALKYVTRAGLCRDGRLVNRAQLMSGSFIFPN